jgi:hypothetical protein
MAEMVRAILDGRKTQTRRIATHGRMVGTKAVCPYGVPGFKLWVKEGWCAGRGYDADPAAGLPTLAARDIPAGVKIHYLAEGPRPPWAGRIRSPLHMPRAHARIVLGITETRLGRLQDITEEDALAEGIAPAPGQPAIEAFEGLWAFIHGEDGQKSWAANPMVWAISFVRLAP